MAIPWNRLVVACLVLAGPASAQDKDSWNGTKVVTRYSRPLRGEGNTFLDNGTRFRVYTVKKVEDDRVRVSARGVEGWLLIGDVIPLKDAAEFYTEELRDNPNNASARNWRGMIRNALGDLDGSIEDYTEAIKLGQQGPHALNNRGIVRSSKKEYDKAIEDFDAALAIDPDHTLSHCNKGMALRKKHDYAAALACFDKALELDPKLISALNEKAWMLATCEDGAVRDGKQAVTIATQACELASWKDDNLIDTLAAAYAELGFFEQAARHQQESIDKSPAGSEARKKYTARLALYRKKKAYQEP